MRLASSADIRRKSSAGNSSRRAGTINSLLQGCPNGKGTAWAFPWFPWCGSTRRVSPCWGALWCRIRSYAFCIYNYGDWGDRHSSRVSEMTKRWTEEVHSRRAGQAEAKEETATAKGQSKVSAVLNHGAFPLAAAIGVGALVLTQMFKWMGGRQRGSASRAQGSKSAGTASPFRFPAVKPKSSGKPAGKAVTATQPASSLPRNKQSNNKKNKQRKAERKAAKAEKQLAVQETKEAGRSSTSGKSTCAGCKKTIQSKVITAMDKEWHADCFCCELCKKSFVDEDGEMEKFRPHGESTAVCEDCYASNVAPQCFTCGKPCTGTEGPNFNGDQPKSTIIALGRHFHKECFKCSYCSRRLTGSFYVRNNRPVCSTCGGR
eukprot:jgi/Mesvir1/28638/Mv15063-RA.1